MPAIRSVSERSSDSGSQSSESVLQHGYFIAAAVIIIALIILRIFVLRWRNQSVHDFFRIGASPQYANGSHSHSNSNYISAYCGTEIAPLPAAYRSNRRVRAADIDAHGRRLGTAGENLDGKDALPAYDNMDRPPKYIEAGWSQGTLHPREQSAVNPSSGGPTVVVHPNAADGTPGPNVDQHFYENRTESGLATHRDPSDTS